jgi:hypothetical protein
MQYLLSLVDHRIESSLLLEENLEAALAGISRGDRELRGCKRKSTNNRNSLKWNVKKCTEGITETVTALQRYVRLLYLYWR